MATKAKKEARRQRRREQRAAAELQNLNFRSMRVRAKTMNEADRTVEAFITTETPVMEMDWERYEMVPRVLLTDGAQLPKSRQVPLLDSHNRWTTASQLGSIRQLAKEDGGVSGRLMFSATAEDEWTKVREGHVTDVSAGFEVLDETYVPAGESKRIRGRDFTGPVNVATKWRLREGSITPIGADEAAKLRGLDPANLPKPKKETPKVKPELRKRCVECGMDEKLTDEQAMDWLAANATRVLHTPLKAPEPVAATLVEGKPLIDAGEIARSVSEKVMKEIEQREKLQEQARKDQREAFERDIDATLKLVFGEDVPTDVRSACMGEQSIDKARERIAAEKKKRDEALAIPGRFIQPGPAQRDKHREALQTALTVRAYDLRGFGMADKLLPTDQRAKGWDEFRNVRLLDFARECLIADGYSYQEVRSLTGEQLAKAAMGWPEKVGLRSAGYAYHTTGSLAHITLDAINKNLTNGYNEAPSTWQGPMRQAASVPDFKQKHVIKFSAAGNLPIWQDNKEPHETAFSNEKESYAIEARAETASFSWQLFVNDDMDALSRVPAALGAAARRTVNAVAWSQVTSNPKLSDGQALFLETATGNRKRSNLTTGSATPTVSTLQTMTNKMMQMRGLNTPEGNESDDILNITPVYIVGPSALRTTIMQLINSTADPAASGNSGIFNPARGLVVVIEPRLDANSTTAWYLFASPTQIDTIEVTFLQGQETPVTNSYVDEATWSRKVTVVQSFAAKAIDHRGVQKHNGV